jgi:hypothetical protein
MRRRLIDLPPGTRFLQPDLGLTGTLLMVNDCRARVRLDQPTEEVEFIGPDGQPRRFRASRTHETSWASTVVVEALSVDAPSERDLTMAKKAAKKSSVKTAAKPKAGRTKKADGKLSQLDAAVKVLTEFGEPMTTKAMIEAMAAKGYWTSPGGQTPAAMLYSALIREIAKKGKESRFAKVDRGEFGLNDGKGAAKQASVKKVKDEVDAAAETAAK